MTASEVPKEETAPGLALRIGDVARLTGTTPRTIRYYEEIGLLEPAEDRISGRHRVYTEQDVERLREIVRFRDLLGVKLDELKDLMAAEDARAAIREQFHRSGDPVRRSGLLEEALGHLDRQLALVRRRRHELDALEDELVARRDRVTRRLEDERSASASGRRS